MLKSELLTRRMPQGNLPENSLRLSSDLYRVDPAWVQEAFLADMVRLGTGAERQDITFPLSRELPQVGYSDVQLQAFVERIDTIETIEPSRERYSYLQRWLGLPNRFGEAEQIFTLLCHPFWRKGSYELMGNEFMSALYHQIERCSRVRIPLEIVLPTLPFKDQCAVTTQQRPEVVDLGERLFLLRLDALVGSIEAVSDLPVRIRIISDGNVYSHIFTLSSGEAASQYLQTCRQFVADQGMSDWITITDMADLVDREPQFAQVQERIRQELRRLVESGNDPVGESWTALVRGMLFNCQLPAPFNNYAEFTPLSQLPLAEIQIRHPEVYQIITHAAVEYASFLLTMRRLQILSRSFTGPGVIRATVHPKRGQLGLHTLGSEVAPYNGVTVIDTAEFVQNPSILNQRWYSCQRYWRVLEETQGVTQVLDQQGNTWCYARE